MSRTTRLIVSATACGLLTTSGCATAQFDAADRQVRDLLRQRQSQTLGYVPQTTAGPEQVPVRPGPAAFRLVPATLVADDVPPPAAVAVAAPAFGPLGPPGPSADPAEARTVVFRGVVAAEANILRRLTLGPPAPTEHATTTVDLFQAIRLGVQFNRTYRSRTEDVYLAALDVTLQRHLFRPRPFASTAARYTRAGRAADYNSALTVTQQAGFRQQLPLGGEVVASGLVEFVNALDGNAQSGERADLVLQASLPLLRGAGMVNLEPLVAGERELVYQIRAFERYRRGFAVDVSDRYFRLLTSRQRIRNRHARYTSALSLVELMQGFFEAGTVSELEVRRAQQQALGAEDSLNQAQEQYDAQVDRFKLFLGLDVTSDLDVAAIDLEVPDLTGIDEAPQEAFERALALRLDVQTARDRIDDARRQVAVADNALLPDLSLTARGRVGSDAGDPFHRITGDTADVSTGITLDWPLDRVRERNAYRRSRINLDRAARQVEEFENLVVVEVRESLRRLRTARATVHIQTENMQVARRRLEFAENLLQMGLASDSRDVIEAQNALLEARDAFEAAQADLRLSVLQFLLDTDQLRVDPESGSIGSVMTRPERVRPPARPGVPR